MVSCSVFPSGQMFSLYCVPEFWRKPLTVTLISPHKPRRYKLHRKEQRFYSPRFSRHQGWGLQSRVPFSCCFQSWLLPRQRPRPGRVRRETTSEARRAAPRKAQHPARPARSLAGLPSLAPLPHPCLTVPLVGCPTPLQVCGPARGSPGKGSGSHGKSPPGSHSLRYFVTTTSLFCYHDVRSRDPGAPSHHRRLRGQHRVHELRQRR